MKKKLLLSLGCAFIGASTLFSQTTNLGGPISWKGKLDPNVEVPKHKMLGFDLATIQAEDAINDEVKDRPWRFGYKYQTDFSLENSGIWVDLPGGNRLWRLEIIAPGAMTMNLLLDNVHIPEGAHLYLSDKDRTNRVGAYTSRNNNSEKELGTELIHGDHMVVEYFEPKDVIGQGSFTITDVVHGYRSLNIIQDQLLKALNSSGGCNIDVNCERDQSQWFNLSWEDQIRSVAMIVVNGNGSCTGALINNTCNDGTPYFLTANHCLVGSTANWAFRFNWNSPEPNLGCSSGAGQSADPGPPYDQTANGATTLVSGTQADHALLQITNMTVQDAQNWNAFYAGWNREETETAITGVVGIHHPSGDVKKICRADEGNNNNISHSTQGGAEVWYMNTWTEGVTEPGSSGSPLFDQNGRIIGQLYGGQAACAGNANNGSYDFYGRLGVSWGLGIDGYLAPSSCGTAPLILDGYNPNGPADPDNAGITGIVSPSGNICGSLNINPTVTLRNFGGNDLTSVTINYNVDGDANQTYSWTGTLAPLASVDVSLPTMSSTGGAHTFNASTSNPNGITDTDPSNDAVSGNFTLTESGVLAELTLNTDCWGHETYWELLDNQNSVVYSGGNTSGIAPGGGQGASSGDPGAYENEATITEAWCLAEACYDFVIYDDYGDGLNGGSPCSTIGSYTIVGNGQTLVDGNPNFGNSETTNFCLGGAEPPVGLGEFTLNDFKIYPNPNNGQLNVEIVSPKGNITKIYVTDLTGRTIFSSTDISTNMSIDLSKRASGTYLLRIAGETSEIVSKIMKN